MTRPQVVALVLGLVAIFAVAMVVGVGPGDHAVPETRAGSGEASPEVRTAAYTVVAGVFVFVLGQIAQRFYIEPIQEQKKVLGEATFAVRYYSGTLLFGVGAGPYHYKAGSPEARKEASDTLYRLSAKVYSSLSIPFYRVFERLKCVKEKETIEKVSLDLKAWALYVRLGDSRAASRYRAAVAKALDIPYT